MIETIKNYRDQGLTWSEIDTKLGTKTGTSWARAKREGLIPTKKKWSFSDREFLKENRNSLGLKACAEHLGFSYDFVKKKSAELSKDLGKMEGFPVDRTFVPKDSTMGILDWEYVETGQLHFGF